MARKRFLHPDMWLDEKFRHLSRLSRLLFIGMITIADDEGRLIGAPVRLQGEIFPYDEDVNPQIIRECLSEIITTLPSVLLYCIKGRDIIQFANWSRYQKPDHPTPSKLPPPPEQCWQETREELANISGSPREELANISRSGYGGGEGYGIGSGTTTATVSSNDRNDAQRPETDERLAAIATVYENEIGPISGMVTDKLQELAARDPPGWFEAAVKEAVRANVRKLTYVESILDRWRKEGFGAQRNNGATAARHGGGKGKAASRDFDGDRWEQFAAGNG